MLCEIDVSVLYMIVLICYTSHASWTHRDSVVFHPFMISCTVCPPIPDFLYSQGVSFISSSPIESRAACLCCDQAVSCGILVSMSGLISS